jgi:hypothetical protein
MKKMIFLMMCLLLMSAAPIHAENNNRTATKTEQVTNQATDQNPVVGKDKKGRTIHQGKKGGLYYWTTTKSGKNAGKARKGYLTKAEKEEFYREHPNVKRPTNN